MDAVKAVGCVIAIVEIEVQLLASLTVTVYVPIDKPVAVAVVCPFDHK